MMKIWLIVVDILDGSQPEDHYVFEVEAVDADAAQKVAEEKFDDLAPDDFGVAVYGPYLRAE